MNRIRIRPMLLVCLLLLPLLGMLPGCEEQTFESNAYKSLVAAGTTYDATMRALAEAHHKGKIPDAQWENAKAIAHVYYGLFHSARVMLEEYVGQGQTAAQRERIQGTMTAMALRLAELLDYAREIGVGVKHLATEEK